MRFLVLLCLFSWSWLFNNETASTSAMPEICDNGIDDDMDGLIDLNDTADCPCLGIPDTIYTPSSLIPNPSFEDTLCCPKSVAQMQCAADWIQASWATTDFFHICDFDREDARGTPPFPLPSGEAFVGFLDVGELIGVGLYKEYVGACLNQAMVPGQNYTMQFYLGFGIRGHRYSAGTPTTIYLYGTNDCAGLPFGGPLFADCPAVLADWFVLGSVTLEGYREWVKGEINFTAPSGVEAIAIGSGCDRATVDSYYFLDELILNQANKFNPTDLSLEGQLCESSVTLSANKIPDLDYQWFRNGIALQGQNSNDITLLKQDTGTYIVRVSNGVDCELSDPFPYYPLDYKKTIDTTICVGEYVEIEGQRISTNFYRRLSYPSSNYCDSIIEIYVTVMDTVFSRVDTSICASETVSIGGQDFNKEGVYRVVMTAANGCDSIVSLNVQVRDTLLEYMDTTICQGSSIDVNGVSYSQAGVFVQHFSTSEGCDAKLEITLNHFPKYLIGSDTSLCEGESLIFGGPPVMANGIYPVQHYTSNGCDSTINYNVTLIQPKRSIVDTSFCQGDFIELDGRRISLDTVFSSIYPSYKGCDSVVTYQVSTIEFHYVELDTQICRGQFIVVNGDTLRDANSYVIQKKDDVGCDSTWSVTLRHFDVPRSVLDTTICFNEAFEWQGQWFDQSINQEFTLTSNSGCDSIVELRLHVMNEPEITTEILQEILCHDDNSGIVQLNGIPTGGQLIWEDGYQGEKRQNLSKGTYEIKFLSAEGCEWIFDFELLEPEALQLAVEGKDLNCMDDRSGELIITEMSGGKGDLSVYLNDQLTYPNGNVISGLSAGLYNIRLIDENFCETEMDMELAQTIPGYMEIMVSKNEVTVGDTVVLNLWMESISAPYIIEWIGPNGTNCIDCQEWKVVPPEGQSQYFVTVEDVNGCIYEASAFIEAISHFYVPNVFSPNGDQLNDYFTVFSDESIFEISSFQVFDRWGALVHQSFGARTGDVNGAWNGTFKGRNAMPGVYVYVIEIIDDLGEVSVLSGDITLTR